MDTRDRDIVANAANAGHFNRLAPSDPDFEAMKDITRLAWLINFEAVATVGNDEDAVPPSSH